jgi:cytochrome P450
VDLSTIPLEAPSEEIDCSADFTNQWGGFEVDPYPVLAAMLAESPVLHRDVFTELGLTNYWNADGRRTVFTVTGYDEVNYVLRSPGTFSSTVNAEASSTIRGLNLNMMDPPEHTRLRSILGRALSPARVHEWMDGLIKHEIDRLVEVFSSRGRADLHAEFSYVLPYRVTHKLFRLSEADYDKFHDLGIWTLLYGVRPEHAAYASKALTHLLQPQIDESRGRPGTDVVSLLANAEPDPLTDEEIVAFLRLLIPAGAETTSRALGLTFYGLLANPDQLQLLREDESWVGKAVNEGLRWEVPFGIEPRVVTSDTELAGVALPANSLVLISLSAANRDPKYFPHPDDFDITRSFPVPIVSFGFGPHSCLGMNLAKGEIDASLRELLDRLPNLRLDHVRAAPRRTGFGARGVDALPVLFDATTR